MESCWDHVGRLMIFVGAIVVALRIVLWKHSRNRRAAKEFFKIHQRFSLFNSL